MFVIIKKGEIVGIKRVLYNSFKVIMITKYWKTIGYTNICESVQDHRIYPSKYRTCIKASKAEEIIKLRRPS